MECPACKGVMVVAEFQKIELDHCTRCLGVWFDAGELELLAERLARDGAVLTMDEIMALPAEEVVEKARRCPICGEKMLKVGLGSQPRVLVDVCPRRDGIWFDHGELSQVIAQTRTTQPAGATEAKPTRMIRFLGEAFEAEG
ncbi:MAG: hypothetical protein FJ012_01530 [Chloroflexi bacterium]|nr:hypothetical protein [Chloroflexota bacterium]